jgi:hypothetical protein
MAVPTVEAATPTVTDQDIELIIHSPRTLTELPVGQEVIISGVLAPPQAGDVEIQIVVAGNQTITQTTTTASETGDWNAAVVIPPQITGPADVKARFLATNTTSVNQVFLVADAEGDGTVITINRPAAGDTAVAGYMVLFDGRVQNPLDETVTIAVLDNDCTTAAATQSFIVSGGDWYGFTIVSSGAQPGPACAVAYTGTRGEPDGREYRVPLTILSPDDPEAILLQLGNQGEIALRAGDSTYLFGIAINAPDDEVHIKLEADDPAQPSALITSATAYANQYGFWEIDLEIPAEAAGNAHLTITIGQNEEAYREIRLPVSIQE